MGKDNIKFEDLKDLNYGDQIIMQDPIGKGMSSYVLMSNINDKSFYFVDGEGASLMVESQTTLDGFNVSQIDKTHPSWSQNLCDHGKQLGNMLDKFTQLDNIKEKDIL